MATYSSSVRYGAPRSGRFAQGDVFTDAGSNQYECVRSGIPGIWEHVGPVALQQKTSAGLGTKNGSTVSVVEYGAGGFHQTVLTMTATPITVTDEAGVSQYGGVKVYTFPAGLINMLGAVVGGNLTLGVTGTIIATFTGVNALGTAIAAATGAATLVTTAATWLQQVSNATASGSVAAIDSVSIATQLTESGGRHVDGTSTAAEVWLNFKIADDATHTTGTGTFTGTITLAWVCIGDN